MKDTSAVLDSLKARIEALSVPSSSGVDGGFHVIIGDPEQVPAGRVCRLQAVAGRQKFPGKTDSTWETQVTLEFGYHNNPTELGQPSAWQGAISDSEALLADLYVWSVNTDGITRLQADLGNIANDGNGFLTVTRTLSVEFTRG